MNRCDPLSRDGASAALEVTGEHARRQDLDSLAAAGDSANQVGAAEDEQRLHLESRHSLDQLGFGERLFEVPTIYRVEAHSAAVALGFDREDSAWSDHDVINVATFDEDIMDRKPATFDETVEDRSDILLSRGTSVPTVDVRQYRPMHDGEEGDRHGLDDHKERVVHTERQTCERC